MELSKERQAGETGMNAQQVKAKQSEQIARASIGRLSNERLVYGEEELAAS